MLVAINASDSEYTANNHELHGDFCPVLEADSEENTIALQGQLVMPAYSVQYLKMV